ncbi:GNAT family N-acetyltransferase [Wenyingzhuangia sp. chi5]|uniref:GNAT family N-acetyltransferase n=1 Tax=Wenyingzhuangia gilva TaxID=3057677 RepID=A0ABT8VS95_9FLAO|nr:GNAT family N-acetyltransferase [Wenyingzhuangia sp. chi5]MDO3694838.1 GNAT family N-acetyltransferase [Wenyingzhuangia sp. chi5]
MEIEHQKDKNRFVLNIDGEIAKVEYSLKNKVMYLTYSEVPNSLRGQVIGKILVEKTFEQLTKEGYKAVAVCSYVKLIAERSNKWKNIIS